jgi:hypothetical protein
MPHAITALEQVTPDWLTTVLRQSGALEHGVVQTVTPLGNPAFNSAVAHLVLTFSPDASATAPSRLLLKRNLNEEWAKRAGAREVAFYKLVTSQAMPLPVVPRCYDAVHDAASGASHLLLLDLSDTHQAPLTRDQILAGDSVPSARHLERVVDALAWFHAYWWEHPALGQGVASLSEWCRSADGFRRYVEQREREWASFSGAVGDWFPADLKVLYERTLLKLPTLWARHLERRVATLTHLTLLQGDCYFSNVLVPKTPDGPVALIDFQGVCADLGPADLVNLCATFWTREQRQDGHREERVLRRYHQKLQACGIDTYAWSDLLTDYRLRLIAWIFVPVWDQTNGSDQAYWWPKLRCLTDAFVDWQCESLL